MRTKQEQEFFSSLKLLGILLVIGIVIIGILN